MPRMFLIDIKDNKKQLLDEEAALKVIDNDFDKINQITILQETTMRYDVKLQDNRRFIVESSKIESFIDEYFPLIESMVLNESEFLGERLQQDYDREYSITIPLIDEYIKLDNSTDEVGGSLSQDTKAVFELRMARWKDSVIPSSVWIGSSS